VYFCLEVIQTWVSVLSIWEKDLWLGLVSRQILLCWKFSVVALALAVNVGAQFSSLITEWLIVWWESWSRKSDRVVSSEPAVSGWINKSVFAHIICEVSCTLCGWREWYQSMWSSSNYSVWMWLCGSVFLSSVHVFLLCWFL